MDTTGVKKIGAFTLKEETTSVSSGSLFFNKQKGKISKSPTSGSTATLGDPSAEVTTLAAKARMASKVALKEKEEEEKRSDPGATFTGSSPSSKGTKRPASSGSSEPKEKKKKG